MTLGNRGFEMGNCFAGVGAHPPAVVVEAGEVVVRHGVVPEGGFFKLSGGFFVVFAHKFAKEKHHAEVGLRTRQAVFGGGFIEREGLADVLGGAVEAEMTNEGLAVVFFSQLLFWVGQVAHRVGLTALGFHWLAALSLIRYILNGIKKPAVSSRLVLF